MENQRILLIGSTGYLGSELTEKLKSAGFDFTVLLRKKIPGFNGRYLLGDLLDKSFLFENIRNFDLIIDLAAVIRTINKERYSENTRGLSNLIAAMEHNNVKRLIYISTQNVNLSAKGPYATSKEACEKILMSTGLEYMIIRPSIIYGIDRQNDFYRLVKLIKRWAIVPVIGSGNNKFQPVLKCDVADFIIRSVNNFERNKIAEIAGKEIVSMNQVIDYISGKLKVSRYKIFVKPKYLKYFKSLIPFDFDGYTEDRVVNSNSINTSSLSIYEGLDLLIGLEKNNI
jgi:NADH dehydrogenase